MLSKKKNNLSFIFILAVAFLALNLIFPQYLNKVVGFIKPKIESVAVLRYIMPRFPEKPFKLGLDLQGGSRLIYEADVKTLEEKERGEAMNGLKDVIERRVNLFGVGEPMVATQEVGGSYRLLVELPGVKDVGKAIEMLGKTPYLEFKEEKEETERTRILEENKKIEEEIKKLTATSSQEEIARLASSLEDPYFQPTKLTGRYLKKSTLGFDQTTYQPHVLLEFNEEGTEIFKELTAKNVGKRLAIYIDNALLSAPVVKEAISGGKAQITGEFTVEEAKDLASNLNAGALPIPIALISQTTVGPTLGAISLDKSLRAGIYGFLFICLFMIVLYRLPGFLSVVALGIYTVVMLALFKLIPVTLTLAGVAGTILSVGMAVDANVLTFERQREEMKKGAGLTEAVEAGFSRAWPSIKDSNLTTFLIALIMYVLGTSFVKGFAFTLGLGILISLFSALFVTRTLMRLCLRTALARWKRLWQ